MMNFPDIASSVLVLIDVQEKLARAIAGIETVVAVQKTLLRAAGILGLDVILTEQYPKGLGGTIPELRELLPDGSKYAEKNTFSCFGCPEFNTLLAAKARRTLIITGIESHICVQQTALDALSKGAQIIIPADAVASRKTADRDIALELLRREGASVTTVEALLFMLMRSSAHPAFKQISALLK